MIIIRIAFESNDLVDIADKLALARLDNGAGAHCFCPRGAPDKVQTFFIDRP